MKAKGRKVSKKGWVVCCIAAALILLCACAYHFRYLFIHTSSEKITAKGNSDFGIADIHSPVDFDGDGIDDQTDILRSARAYISTNPKYKSRYYEGGYPDDGYGVCTDVVANALLGAGYDLRKLVDEDIRSDGSEYGIEEINDNIDFRRVKNLKIYFAHTATALTTDIHEIGEWQGGDIVVFEKHIGIVSDNRNDEGISYVIHHNDPYQAAYEEDILGKRNDIVGHYRV